MKNKRWIIIVAAIVAVLLILIASVIGSYNGMVEEREEVERAWSQISVQLQARADKIPNLVNTVKGYADYEQQTLTNVTEARSAFNNAKTVNEQIEAYDRMQGAVSVWVNAVTEAYPELKANTQFTALMDEISGTENRIAIARKDYNEEVADFNSDIKMFPKSLLANMFGFEAYDYFEASAGAENAPQVSFD